MTDRDPLWDHVTGCRAWAGDPCTCVDQPADVYLAGGLVDAGPGLALLHPGEQYLTRDQLRRQIAGAFDVPFHLVDDAAARDEARLRGAELDRWCDDGGPGDPPARRWLGDAPPRRHRDWLPAAERKVDRARREQLERALRRRARKTDRRRARLVGQLRAVEHAGRRGAGALDVLRTAAAGAR